MASENKVKQVQDFLTTLQSDIVEAIQLIDGKIPTEASGNITKDTIVSIAETGVDYVSLGSITHSAPNIDLSLKAL